MNAALSDILFIDIETVALTEYFDDLPERLKSHWEKKSIRLSAEETPENTYYDRAAIFAEFGKIICIGVGYMSNHTFRVTTLYHEDEKQLLLKFVQVLSKLPAKDKLTLCAHNGKEFDYPYLCRRMLINEIPLPEVLNIGSKKPWEIRHLDTMEMWKFGDYKNFTSLDLLASVFNIKSSKDGIDGSEVKTAYYKEKNIDKILKYCTEDVVVLAQLYCKLAQIKSIEDSIIERV